MLLPFLDLSWKDPRYEQHKLSIKTICSVSSLVELGTVWCKTLTHIISNQFWIEVLSIWGDFSEHDFIKTSSDILSTPIWYNPKISRLTLYLPRWFKGGIKYVGDIVDIERDHYEFSRN